MAGRRRCARRSTSTLAAHAAVGAPATWVLGNHDVCRPVSRYARAAGAAASRVSRNLQPYLALPADFDGRTPPRPRRRPAQPRAARRRLHLPGRGARPRRGRGHAAGGPAGPDLRRHRRRERRPRRLPGAAALDARPATATASARTAAPPPWLPQPAELGTGERRGAGRRSRRRRSSCTARALAIRAEHPALGDGDADLGGRRRRRPRLHPRPGLRLLGEPRCASRCRCRTGPTVLLASADLVDGSLPPDTAAWLRLGS